MESVLTTGSTPMLSTVGPASDVVILRKYFRHSGEITKMFQKAICDKYVFIFILIERQDLSEPHRYDNTKLKLAFECSPTRGNG